MGQLLDSVGESRNDKVRCVTFPGSGLYLEFPLQCFDTVSWATRSSGPSKLAPIIAKGSLLGELGGLGPICINFAENKVSY